MPASISARQNNMSLYKDLGGENYLELIVFNKTLWIDGKVVSPSLNPSS